MRFPSLQQCERVLSFVFLFAAATLSYSIHQLLLLQTTIDIMIRTVVVFALIVVAAQAFVSPANRAVGKLLSGGVICLSCLRRMIHNNHFLSIGNLSLTPCLFINTHMTAKPAFASRTAPKMMIDGSIMEQSAVSAAANTQLIASQVTDFGGYLFPVFGIIALAGLILFLSPPLADPN